MSDSTSFDQESTPKSKLLQKLSDRMQMLVSGTLSESTKVRDCKEILQVLHETHAMTDEFKGRVDELNDLVGLPPITENELEEKTDISKIEDIRSSLKSISQMLHSCNELLKVAKRPEKQLVPFIEEEHEEFPIIIESADHISREKHELRIVNTLREPIENVIVYTCENVYLGTLASVPSVMRLSLPIAIPLATFLRKSILNIILFSNNSAVSDPFEYPLCKICEVQNGEDKVELKIKNNTNSVILCDLDINSACIQAKIHFPPENFKKIRISKEYLAMTNEIHLSKDRVRISNSINLSI